MIDSLFNTLFHAMVNSFIVFFAVAIFIEFFLFAFRIKNERISFLCRLFPVIKLPVDIFAYKFLNISHYINFNPFSCEQYLYQFLLKILSSPLQLKLIEYKCFTVSDFIAWYFSSAGLYCAVGALALITLFVVGREIVRILAARQLLKNILASSEICTREIMNERLAKNVTKGGYLIMISALVKIPMATKGRYVIFPKHLIEGLSQEEYEAIIAHEVEHLRWKDPYVRWGCHVVSVLFWWIPLNWWLKRLEIEQEKASDRGVYKYGIGRQVLASAIVRVVQGIKEKKRQMWLFCQVATPESIHLYRLKNILNFTRTNPQRYRHFNCFLGIMMSLFVFMSFWIC